MWHVYCQQSIIMSKQTNRLRIFSFSYVITSKHNVVTWQQKYPHSMHFEKGVCKCNSLRSITFHLRSTYKKSLPGQPQSANKLSLNCQQIVLKLPKNCPQSVNKLSLKYQQTVLKLPTNCPQSANKLSSKCQQIVHFVTWNMLQNNLCV